MSAPAITKPPVDETDVRDLPAFCAWIVATTLGRNERITERELEEARAEAVVLAIELHAGPWDPSRSFATFLRGALPNKLISWWRVELRQSGLGAWSGSTASYRYHGRVSLDDEYEDEGDTALTVNDRRGLGG